MIEKIKQNIHLLPSSEDQKKLIAEMLELKSVEDIIKFSNKCSDDEKMFFDAFLDGLLDGFMGGVK